MLKKMKKEIAEIRDVAKAQEIKILEQVNASIRNI